MNTVALLPATWLEPRKPMIRAITIGNVTWIAAAAVAFVARPEIAPRIGAAERLALAAATLRAPGFDWTLNTTLAVLVWLATTYA